MLLFVCVSVTTMIRRLVQFTLMAKMIQSTYFCTNGLSLWFCERVKFKDKTNGERNIKMDATITKLQRML